MPRVQKYKAAGSSSCHHGVCSSNFAAIFVAHIHEPIFLQAMYAYMKAAYLSMLSTEERQPFGESDVALFR